MQHRVSTPPSSRSAARKPSIDATRNLLIHVRALRKATITQSDRAARSIIDHLKIIEALEKRDTELAERLTRQHTLDLAAHVDRILRFSRLDFRRRGKYAAREMLQTGSRLIGREIPNPHSPRVGAAK